MPSVLELRAVADGGDDRRAVFGPTPLILAMRRQSSLLRKTASIFLSKEAITPIEITEEIVELRNRVAGHRRRFVAEVRKDLGDCAAGAGDALGDGEAAIEQQTADLVR
jgi:hypothetical protein